MATAVLSTSKLTVTGGEIVRAVARLCRGGCPRGTRCSSPTSAAPPEHGQHLCVSSRVMLQAFVVSLARLLEVRSHKFSSCRTGCRTAKCIRREFVNLWAFCSNDGAESNCHLCRQSDERGCLSGCVGGGNARGNEDRVIVWRSTLYGSPRGARPAAADPVYAAVAV